ncbi:hypothetical protein [Alkalicoccus urumqiensis]|uniref:Uncharacterized protein n=1 Tax=Alkalicoccus urumqiensis TaxID=1548213 RepID=A0A2P6ME71_ALKUR|nr:hypothetical protein [Alkalicoccus urumqiensis]PRO64564.1 hypothetical protein C6I21_13780 [Alkalicoccus urumqiensis]
MEKPRKLNKKKKREIENLLRWYYSLDPENLHRKQIGAFQFIQSFLDNYGRFHPREVKDVEEYFRMQLQNKPIRYTESKEAFQARMNPLYYQLRVALIHQGFISK